MKTLTKPETVAAMLFLIVCFLWLFGGSLLPFLLTRPTLASLVPSGAHKGILAFVILILTIYLYGEGIRKKTCAQQKQYFNLFAVHPSPMAIVELETKKFLAVNKASIDCYGYSNDEFLSLSINEIRLKEEDSLLEKDMNSVTAELKKAGTRKHRKKNGEIFVSEVSSCEIYYDNKKCILFLARDITEMVNAKEEKRIAVEEKTKQQDFTSFVLENFPVDVAVFDKDHKYILINKTAVKNDEMRQWMIGKDDFDYFATKGTDMSIAEERRKKFLNAVAGESNEWIDQYLVDGKIKYVLRKFFPYHENGKLKYVYGYGTDISEVKKAQVERDEYIKQLENMAFITSHRIRQPICNLQGLISLIEMGQPVSAETKELICGMKESVKVMDSFTKDLAASLHEYKQNLSSAENKM